MSQRVPTLKHFFLEQLDREAALTRKAIERFPDGHSDFKPHERSMAFGYLASLISQILGWIPVMLDRDEFDLDDPANASFRNKPATQRAELLTNLEKATAAARRALEFVSDEELLGSWTFKVGGRVAYTKPRYIVIADSVFSHLAHHRGQFTVYLRLHEAKVPALYGPSADEQY
jgi:uncharacterized damage-inducible protein DinB